jgi:type IV pilus assembly protein PilE
MRRHSGFTLIEAMVTVAIIAILAGIALPAYTNYIIRAKLQEATSNLLAMRTKLELYYQDNRSYVGACAAGTVAPLPPPASAGDPAGTLKYVTISCPTLTDGPPQAYTIQAIGNPGTNMAGLTLTINEANLRKTVSVPAGWGTPSGGGNCWVTKKSGEC